jgi:hypothetical protein
MYGGGVAPGVGIYGSGGMGGGGYGGYGSAGGCGSGVMGGYGDGSHVWVVMVDTVVEDMEAVAMVQAMEVVEDTAVAAMVLFRNLSSSCANSFAKGPVCL